MQAPSPPTDIVHFGIFQIDLKARELHKAGVKVKLQEQPFRVLALLVDRAGQVVTREELQEKIWPTDAYVAFDQGLNNAIKKVRDALGDSADSPRFIETLARRGYRFVAPVGAMPQRPAPTSISIRTFRRTPTSRAAASIRSMSVPARRSLTVATARPTFLLPGAICEWATRQIPRPR